MTANNGEKVPLPILRNRLSAKELEYQIKLFSDKNIFSDLIDSTHSYLVVLNEYRQLVYANKAFKDSSLNKDEYMIYGKRPGELFNCQNAFLTPTGCGTSDFCDTCGALKVILSSLNGSEDVQECRIIQKDTHDAIDLRVWARQLKIDEQIFSIFSFVDISHEKRRAALERIFFHDVLNSACGISGYLSLFNDSSHEEIDEMVPVVSGLIDKLLGEIKSQRDLSHAENAELIVKYQNCNSLKIIKDLNNLYDKISVYENKKIEIFQNCETIDFITDESLVSRVLSNMIKNAFENTSKGGIVKIGCYLSKDKVRFYVNNAGYIPQIIQQQIFQRSFSTKGIGRGLGTYSMRLITERYLKGNVFFTTTELEGTTFIAEYPLNLNGE